MNLFYEEAGAFKIGKVLQEQGNAYQVETLHGKRTKVKASSVMISFTSPDGHEFARLLEAGVTDVDVELLYECAPTEEFGFEEMAEEYYGEKPSAVQKGIVLNALHGAPIYFHRKGKGRYRAAPADILKAALAGLEKKRRAAEEQEAWATALANRELPEVFARQAAVLLARPDKNSAEYKALMLACTKAGRSPELLLLECGAFDSIHALMRAKFTAIHFPKGTSVDLPLPQWPEDLSRLPVAPVRAFSIDDVSTTEIDDAFSVRMLEDGRAEVGVHIAAPGLLIPRDSAFDRLARDRMSTVYSPGDKITMLPENLVELGTLAEGRTVPSASIYIAVDLQTGELVGEPRSILEMVPIGANLRHNHLDEVITKEVLEDPNVQNLPEAGEFFPALKILWLASCNLRMQRELVRGQPEKHSRIDYNFYVTDGVVEITPRRRDAPLDLLVAEWMIYVNCQWGALLQSHSVPGIYRVQPQAGRVRMSIHAAPHAGLGVPQYAWSTSPLRRYVDLINQQQLISVIRGLPPTYTASDADLLSAVNTFDITYKAYAEYQQSMERYWCLRWVQQKQRARFEGVVVKDELVRLHEIPLFVRLVGVTSPGRGAQVEVELDQIDELTLTVSCKLISIQSGTPTLLVDEEEEDIPVMEVPVSESLVLEDEAAEDAAPESDGQADSVSAPSGG